MTEDEFWEGVAQTNQANPNWRLGQTAFNVLFEMRPDLSEQVRGTNIDPFYARTEEHPQMVLFRQFVRDHWDDPHHVGQMAGDVLTCDCGWTATITEEDNPQDVFNSHVVPTPCANHESPDPACRACQLSSGVS